LAVSFFSKKKKRKKTGAEFLVVVGAACCLYSSKQHLVQVYHLGCVPYLETTIYSIMMIVMRFTFQVHKCDMCTHIASFLSRIWTALILLSVQYSVLAGVCFHNPFRNIPLSLFLTANIVPGQTATNMHSNTAIKLNSETTIHPSQFPSHIPSVHHSPTRTPTHSPTHQSIPIVIFESNLAITGYTGTVNSDHTVDFSTADKNVIRHVFGEIMNISAYDVQIHSTEQTTTEDTPVHHSLRSSTDTPEKTKNTRELSVSTHNITIAVETSVSMINYEHEYHDNTTAVYTHLTHLLTEAEHSGAMLTLIHHYVTEYTASTLSSVHVISLEHELYMIQQPPTYSPTEAPTKKKVFIGLIIGLVVGGIVGLFLFVWTFSLCCVTGRWKSVPVKEDQEKLWTLAQIMSSQDLNEVIAKKSVPSSPKDKGLNYKEKEQVKTAW
jgi:hypothetical protein